MNANIPVRNRQNLYSHFPSATAAWNLLNLVRNRIQSIVNRPVRVLVSAVLNDRLLETEKTLPGIVVQRAITALAQDIVGRFTRSQLHCAELFIITSTLELASLPSRPHYVPPYWLALDRAGETITLVRPEELNVTNT